MKYEKLAKDIIKNVGGKENVSSLTHCITRLRFKLKDEEKANTDVLKEMDGVVTVIKSAGQYQVVIGNHVPDVFSDVVAIGGFQTGASEKEGSEKKAGLLNSLVDIISGVFAPMLAGITAGGMIKGFNALFVALNILNKNSGTYAILNAAGDSIFYFLPIILGYTSAKKFKLNEFVGMAIGGALLYPSVSALSSGKPLYTIFNGSVLESSVYLSFLGVPVILMNYSSSVIPIVLTTYVGSKIEKALRKIIPDVVKSMLVPFFTLLIIVPLAFIVIGPLATWAGKLLGALAVSVNNASPVLAGLFIGGFWQVFVIFGVHWGFVPIMVNNVAVLGYDPIVALAFAASFAQTGVVLGVLVKTKNKKLRTLAVPAFISGLFGITEPAIYGITLPRKKPFILSCIAASVGGGILGFMGSRLYIVGGNGIFKIPSFIGQNGIDRGFYGAIITMIVASLLGFVLMLFIKLEDEEETKKTDDLAKKEESTSSLKQEVITSPLKGAVKSLSSVKDEAFSTGALGKGIAIEPKEGKVVSPFNGTVTALLPTSHAIGITSKNGAEVLIHVGMDTVQLEGKYFNPKVRQGDEIKLGQVLLEFDINAIHKEGYSTITPVIITNSNSYSDVVETDQNDISYNEELITVMV